MLPVIVFIRVTDCVCVFILSETIDLVAINCTSYAWF